MTAPHSQEPLFNTDIRPDLPWPVIEEVLGRIDLINIACGTLPVSVDSIRPILREAAARRVRVGALCELSPYEQPDNHPETISATQLISLLQTQTSILKDLLAEAGLSLHHVKLHGALSDACEASSKLSETCVDFMYAELEDRGLICPVGGMLHAVTEARGVPLLRELLAYKSYTNEAQLGATIRDPSEALARISQWKKTGLLPLENGHLWLTEAETVCLPPDPAYTIKI